MAEKFRGTINYPKVFKRGERKNYYFRYTPPGSTPKDRKLVSTGCADYVQAMAAMIKFVDEGMKRPRPKMTLREMLTRFSSPETNPKWIDAKMFKRQYSETTAYGMAYRVRRFLKLFDASRGKRYLDMGLDQFFPMDVKDIAVVISEINGRSRSSQLYFEDIKTMFSQALKDGIIVVNPAAGLSELGYDEKKRYSISPDTILWMFSHENWFPDQEFRDFLRVACLTGMRRGEILGITKDRIDGDLLTIDRQWQVAGTASLRAPKCHVVRQIPLCDEAVEIIEAQTPGEEGRLFTLSSEQISKGCLYLRACAKGTGAHPEVDWDMLTPHTFRHSMNSNLILLAGCSPMLVGRYLAWKHEEDLSGAQPQYTHAYARDLLPIRDAVEKIYPRVNPAVVYLDRKA